MPLIYLWPLRQPHPALAWESLGGTGDESFFLPGLEPARVRSAPLCEFHTSCSFSA